jgi:hypothetical protein
LESPELSEPPDLERQGLTKPSELYISPNVPVITTTRPLRNFTLPRERCLNPLPVNSTRSLPIPPPYVATGMISGKLDKSRPLPALPNEVHDPHSLVTHTQLDNRFVIRPLRIKKVNLLRNSLPLENEPQSETSAINLAQLNIPSVTSFLSLEADEAEHAMNNRLSVRQHDQSPAAELQQELAELFNEESTMITPKAPASTPSVPSLASTPPTSTSPAPSNTQVVISIPDVSRTDRHRFLASEWRGQPGFLSL